MHGAEQARRVEHRNEQPSGGVEGQVADLRAAVAAADGNEALGLVVRPEVAAPRVQVEGPPAPGRLYSDGVGSARAELVGPDVAEGSECRSGVERTEEPVLLRGR